MKSIACWQEQHGQNSVHAMRIAGAEASLCKTLGGGGACKDADQQDRYQSRAPIKSGRSR